MARSKKKPTIEANGHKISTSREYASDDDDDDENEASDAFNEARVTPVNFDVIDESVTKYSSICWGCVFKYGKQKQKNKSKEMDALWELYIDNKDTISDHDLSRMISSAHNETIHLKEIESGDLKSMAWSPDAVMRHLKFHMTDVRKNIQSTIRDYSIIEAKLKHSMFVEGENPGTYTTDYAALTAYLNVGTKKSALVATLKNII